MNFLVSIIQTQPVSFHFSFFNPRHSEETIYVPRALRPLGYFIRLKITNQDNVKVFQTEVPKAKPKMHPDRLESYLAIDPGYSYGAVLQVEDFKPGPGIYELSLSYSNQEYRGFAAQPLGEITYQTKLSFHVSE